MNSALLLGLMAAQMLVLAEEPAVWECDFGKIDQTQWKWHNAVGELTAGALRVRVPTVPQKSTGSFGQQVPAAPAACYLQVLLGDMEDSAAAPTVGNASTGGKEFGPLLAGWNTFSMVAQCRPSVFCSRFASRVIAAKHAGRGSITGWRGS